MNLGQIALKILNLFVFHLKRWKKNISSHQPQRKTYHIGLMQHYGVGLSYTFIPQLAK